MTSSSYTLFTQLFPAIPCLSFSLEPKEISHVNRTEHIPVIYDSVTVVGLSVKHQVFHPGKICFLTGLIEQHHQHNPFDILKSDFITVKR